MSRANSNLNEGTAFEHEGVINQRKGSFRIGSTIVHVGLVVLGMMLGSSIQRWYQRDMSGSHIPPSGRSLQAGVGSFNKEDAFVQYETDSFPSPGRSLSDSSSFGEGQDLFAEIGYDDQNFVFPWMQSDNPEVFVPIWEDELLTEDDIGTVFEEDQNDIENNETYLVEEDLDIMDEVTAIPTEVELVDPELMDEEEEVEDIEYVRKLSQCNLHNSLECNAYLENTVCSSFSALVQSMNSPGSTPESMLTIPCGECYEVDISDGSELEFPGGLLIEGKLYFPSTANLTIRTKFVWVVGLLKMETPAVENRVKFLMYGEEMQVYENKIREETCGADTENGPCIMGSKVIAVMGGRLEIEGTEEDCPAWEKLSAVGEGSLRAFPPPCENGNCWSSNTIQLTGRCAESPGHSNAMGKYTVYCPIESTGVHIGGGTSSGVKFTSIEQDRSFEYPEDESGEELSLTMAGQCHRAGHSNHFNKCTIYCPLKTTGWIGSGFRGPLTFKSVANAVPFEMPKTGGQEVNLKLASPCHNSGGHTNAWKRCVIGCQVDSTAPLSSGSSWSPLELTSRYEEPEPFVYPSNGGKTLELQKKGKFRVSWGHSRHPHIQACVFYGQLEPTATIRSGATTPITFTNAETGNEFTATRVMHWSWAGSWMFLYADDYELDKCQDAADALNEVFEIGDKMDVSYSVAPGFDGNTFAIDRVMHWSHARKWFYFFPSEQDVATCSATAEDFNSKFKPGYKIDVGYPAGPEGGQEFHVDGVHHWAWAKSGLFFFPENSDPSDEACSATARDFSAMFPMNYGIDVSYRKVERSGPVVAEASKGVHHWSWNTDKLFFFPDETAAEFNEKFLPGMQLQVSYTDTMDYDEIEVSPEAARCWKPGTEILLTSHTRNQWDQQVRTIVSTNPSNGSLKLDKPIDKPISTEDHPDFAVEVASLNRRIIFDAESDSDDESIGGHLVIHHTNAPQHIEGVEIRNFGQQGRLGKYPLHFHMSEDSPESLVKKNVVRHSNQRGYVIHLTNQVTLEENVAYDITGHCYFLEDGRETGNTLRKNLGTGIKSMPEDRVNALSATSGRAESDGNVHGFNGASVFWISNPSNNFYGNVAAGGEKNGYWFETRGPRMHMALGAFEDNEVHSSARFAFSVYSPGWRPTEDAHIRNLKVYRNKSWGAFLHATTNIKFDGGLFADNGGKDAMISRGDNIEFVDSTFIGHSEFAGNVPCHGKVGIHLDPVRFKETALGETSGDWKGTVVRNVEFLNYNSQENCPNSAPLKFFSHQTFVKAYNAPHYIENIKADAPTQIEACFSDDGAKIDDMSIEIVADDNGVLTSGGYPGFLVSPKLATMVDGGCEDYNSCLKFCRNACLRTVSVVTGNAAFDDDLVMVVRRTDGTRLTIQKDVRGEGPKNRFDAIYTVALPKASYEISFESLANPGTLHWPKSAFAAMEAAPSCENHLEYSDLTFFQPESSTRPECSQLIHNGNMDGGLDGWHARHHSIDFQATEGVGGSGTLATSRAIGTGNNQPVQTLDVSCVALGDVLEVSYTFKVVSGGTTNLPRAGMEVASFMEDTMRKKTTNWDTVASPDPSNYVAGEWTTVTNMWTVDDGAANADVLEFYITGGDQKILLNNVSITKISNGGDVRQRQLRASA